MPPETPTTQEERRTERISVALTPSEIDACRLVAKARGWRLRTDGASIALREFAMPAIRKEAQRLRAELGGLLD